MLKFCRVQWHTMGFCRRLLLIFMVGVLGAGAAWVALADNTNYSDEDTHIEEAFALLDLFSDSTNASLWLDTNTLSWACFVRWGDPSFTDGDFVKTEFSDLFASCYKINGEWLTNPPCWYVPPDWGGYEEGEDASLNIDFLDRARLTNDVVILALTLFDNPGELRVKLVDTNSMSVTPDDLFGNLLEGSNEVAQVALQIPLSIYSNAVGICIRRISGETIVYNSLVYYPAQDSEAAWLSEYDESFSGEEGSPSEGTNGTTDSQAEADRPASDSDGTGAQEETLSRSETGASVEEQGAEILAKSQESANFTIARSALDGGGTRQSSTNCLMEDTIAQSSAVGLLGSASYILEAGYQHPTNDLLQIWNVGVIPDPFNPKLGEAATLSYVLNTSARSVTVEVYKDVNLVSLVENERQGAGLHSVVWGGTNETGDLVTLGEWSFRIYAADYEGRVVTNEEVVLIKKTIPVIVSVSDDPDPFFPPAQTNAIHYTTSADPAGELTVTIELFAENTQGLPITSASFVDQPIGSHTQLWNGTSSFGPGGTNLADGLYVYRISATDAQDANDKTGTIVLIREDTNTIASADGNVELRYKPDSFTVEISKASGDQLTDAARAIFTDRNLLVQSAVYEITATPSANFVPPAILTFKYDPAILGDIGDKLQIRRYDTATTNWIVVSAQFIDFANHRIIAEIDQLSLFAIFTGEDTTPPGITIISPEEREYYHSETIDIVYEVEDELAGAAQVIVYLNGEEYTEQTINLSNLLGENTLTVVAYDNAGNIGRASVRFTVVIEASVTLKPESLKVNPGVLTAYVEFPEGYDVSGISDATCDGAAY